MLWCRGKLWVSDPRGLFLAAYDMARLFLSGQRGYLSEPLLTIVGGTFGGSRAAARVVAHGLCWWSRVQGSDSIQGLSVSAATNKGNLFDMRVVGGCKKYTIATRFQYFARMPCFAMV